MAAGSLGAFRVRDGTRLLVAIAGWCVARALVTTVWRDPAVVGALPAGGAGPDHRRRRDHRCARRRRVAARRARSRAGGGGGVLARSRDSPPVLTYRGRVVRDERGSSDDAGRRTARFHAFEPSRITIGSVAGSCRAGRAGMAMSTTRGRPCREARRLRVDRRGRCRGRRGACGVPRLALDVLQQAHRHHVPHRNLVDERRHALASLLTAEHGKVPSDALGEIARGIENLEFACGIPNLLKGGFSEQASTGVDVYQIRQPLGVVAGITPFASRRWCRCGCSGPPSRAAIRSS